jgi:hypothetical protein
VKALIIASMIEMFRRRRGAKEGLLSTRDFQNRRFSVRDYSRWQEWRIEITSEIRPEEHATLA